MGRIWYSYQDSISPALSKDYFMPIPLETLDAIVPRVERILGAPPQELEATVEQLAPALLLQQRLEAQAAEIALIDHDATAIEALFREKGLSLPSAYAIFTGGFPSPDGAIPLGSFGEGFLQDFPNRKLWAMQVKPLRQKWEIKP